jgi:hypothetical protein
MPRKRQLAELGEGRPPDFKFSFTFDIEHALVNKEYMGTAQIRDQVQRSFCSVLATVQLPPPIELRSCRE